MIFFITTKRQVWIYFYVLFTHLILLVVRVRMLFFFCCFASFTSDNLLSCIAQKVFAYYRFSFFLYSFGFACVQVLSTLSVVVNIFLACEYKMYILMNVWCHLNSYEDLSRNYCIAFNITMRMFVKQLLKFYWKFTRSIHLKIA